MSLEIRSITDDEVERSQYIRSYSFNQQNRRDLREAVERDRQFYPLDWSLATFEDGEMTAFMRTTPFAMRVNGRALSFGMVGPVVCMPEHRRKGHVGAMLRRAIADMHERGQVISGLGTPHPNLYRKYGWEIAAAYRVYSFPPKEITLLAQPGERGRFRMLAPEDWAVCDRVYRRWGAKRNGPLHRGSVWWQHAIFGITQPLPSDVAVWEDGTGEAQGYVVYAQPNTEDGRHDFGSSFVVRELVAATPDAYLNLIAFVCRHDLPEKITWAAPEDDPFRSLVVDNFKIEVKEDYGMLLRVIDVEAALRGRAPAHPEWQGALTLRFTDSTAPWNEGTWRVEVSDGEMAVEPSTAEPDLSMSATAFAPVYNGYAPASALALGGLIDAKNEEALATADEMFSVLHPPYNSDPF